MTERYAGTRDAELVRPEERCEPDAVAAFARHLARARRAREGRAPIDLLFLGDSLTDNWRRWRGGLRAFVRHFGHWDAAAFGVGNDRTSHVLWRIEHGTLDGLSPRVVIVSVGANQLAAEFSVDGIAASAVAVAEAVLGRLPSTVVLLNAVMPQDDGWEWDVLPKVREINDAIAALVTVRRASQSRIVFLDGAHVLLAADGTLARTLLHDGVHLTPAGYERWARVLAPVVHRLAPPHRHAGALTRVRRALRLA